MPLLYQIFRFFAIGDAIFYNLHRDFCFVMSGLRLPVITLECSGSCRCGKTYKQNNYTYLLTFNSAFIYIFIEIEYA